MKIKKYLNKKFLNIMTSSIQGAFFLTFCGSEFPILKKLKLTSNVNHDVNDTHAVFPDDNGIIPCIRLFWPL